MNITTNMDNFLSFTDPLVQLVSPYLSWIAPTIDLEPHLNDLRSPLATHKYLSPNYLGCILALYTVIAVIVPRITYLFKFHITPWALLHHGIALVLSFFIPYHIILLATLSNYKVWCNSKPHDSQDVFAQQLAYIYGTFYLFKVYELFDVALAHLGNKRLSPSFQFFQAANVFFAWCAAYFAPYGDVYIPVVVNSVVSFFIHAAHIIRIADWPISVPSASDCARYSMYIQCTINLALGIYEYVNKCGYPELLARPFIVYNFLAVFYALVTDKNHDHVKQE